MKSPESRRRLVKYKGVVVMLGEWREEFESWGMWLGMWLGTG